MYLLLLTLHNISRWLVLIFGILAFARSLTGLLQKKTWVARDKKAASLYTIWMDIQLLLGLLLYFFYSPYVKTAFNNFGAAMGDTVTRFFAMEHLFMMLIAVVAAHIGSSLAKKAHTDSRRFRAAAIGIGISLGLVLAMIPWPFMTYSRPLLRLFGIEL